MGVLFHYENDSQIHSHKEQQKKKAKLGGALTEKLLVKIIIPLVGYILRFMCLYN